MRQIEFPRAGSFLPPRLYEFSISRELHDAVVGIAAVSIGNKNIAVRSDGHSGRHIECVRTIARDARLAESYQHFSSGSEFKNLLAFALRSVAIGDPDVSILVHREPVRKQKHSSAKSLQ